MRILVTGSAGFLGGAVVTALARQGHYVIGLDKNLERHSHHFFQHDLTRNLPDKITFDVCIHLASWVGGFLHNAQTEGLEEYEAKLLSTTAAICRSANCHRLIYASTINVFDTHRGDYHGPLRIFSQATPYARAKALGEQLVAEHFEKFAIVRLTNLFGKGQGGKESAGHSHVIPELLRKMRETSELEVFGDGSQVRNFLHRDDAAQFFTRILETPDRLWVSLRSDIHLSIAELATTLLRMEKSSKPIVYKPEYLRYEPRPIERFDLGVPTAVGWSPKVSSLSEGLLH